MKLLATSQLARERSHVETFLQDAEALKSDSSTKNQRPMKEDEPPSAQHLWQVEKVRILTASQSRAWAKPGGC
jgi:hypothetical protein